MMYKHTREKAPHLPTAVSNKKMKENETIKAKIEFHKLNEYGKREGKNQ